MVISPRRWCLRAWVVPWASLATRDCACRRRLRPAGCFLLRVVRSAFEALCGAVCCGASGMSRAIPQAVFQGFEMGSLGLQRSWGCRGKFGHPNCMRLVGREARGSNSCVRLPAQGCCQPYLGCVRLVRVRFAALLDEAVVFVWVTSAVGRDISRDSIQQGGEAARDCGVSGRLRECVVAVSYSPTTHRLQYHRRCRA